MAFMIVPRVVTTSSAELWIGADNESADLDDSPVLLRTELGDRSIAGDWSVLGALGGRHFLRYKSVTLEGLRPGQRYTPTLLLGGAATAVATATVFTLPERLPTVLDPFIVLLGSCFAVGRDGAGAAGQRFTAIEAVARPHVKILCGDQVYLDQPSDEFLLHEHDEPQMQEHFLDTYLRTWSQRGPGFADILSHGGNFFASDDHEFWNNAPSSAPLVLDSHRAAGRAAWLRVATQLYETFQSTARVTRVDVPPLSFCIADTRIDRRDDGETLMRPADLDRVQEWVFGLQGPGVLVLGQPVFSRPATVVGKFVDFGLPDYGQYGRFVGMLNRAAHDVVVLTGDVHFGRIAECVFPASGKRLIEIISSPLALVDDLVGKHFEPAPSQFPDPPIAGLPSPKIETHPFQTVANHFMTLEFGRNADLVQLLVKCWIISGAPPLPSPVVFRTDLT